MNTRKEAEEGVIEFFKSYEKGLLVTGTHQYKKHKLVLKTIYDNAAQPLSILFRTNSMHMVGTHFKDHLNQYKTGTDYGNGFHELFFDTINIASWKNTKYDYDVAILYPIDPLMRDKKLREKIFIDLYNFRDINKIFLVSWTDNPEYDYSIIKDYYVNHIVYDALEEDEEYHKRVLELDKKYKLEGK